MVDFRNSDATAGDQTALAGLTPEERTQALEEQDEQLYYDPDARGYVLAATRLMKLGGVLGVALMAAFLGGLWSRESRRGGAAAARSARPWPPPARARASGFPGLRRYTIAYGRCFFGGGFGR